MSETEGAAAPPAPEYGADRGGHGEPPQPKQKRGAAGGTQLDPDAWMVTFSDLLTLLMTFFVLIFASQDPVPPEKLQQAFGQSTGVFSLFRTGFLERIAVLPRRDISQDLVQVFLNEIGALDIEVQQEERGLVITLPSNTFFAPGVADLNAQARKRIDQLSLFLAVTKHRIRVEGHTDARERVRAPLRDVWELSLSRAHRVLERLLRQGVSQERLSLSGYGPVRPRFANTSRVGRARNRRVEIVIQNRTPRRR